MKLLNYTSSWFSLLLLLIIPLWAGIFYYTILDEIYDSMDDGLENQKMLVIQKALSDSTILNRQNFEEGYYAFTAMPAKLAATYQDTYLDTLMYMQNEEEYEPVRMLKTALNLNGSYYQLRLITSMVEEDDLVTTLLYSLIWLYAGLVVTILLLNKLLIRQIWRPFYQLMQNLKEFRLNSREAFVAPDTRVDEFVYLNATVSALVQSNREVYELQKQFTENAAHELQTPLAISINKLENLAQEAALEPQAASSLESAMANLQRIKRLNQSLLLLSKIENNQYADTEHVRLNEIVQELLDDLGEQAEFLGLSLHFRVREETIWNMNRGLADILVANLIKNAIRHNVPGGEVIIEAGGKKLTVANTAGAGALDKDRIFERFYKGSSSMQSTGLGLSIVRAIARLYSLDVRYEYNEVQKLHFFIISK